MSQETDTTIIEKKEGTCKIIESTGERVLEAGAKLLNVLVVEF